MSDKTHDSRPDGLIHSDECMSHHHRFGDGCDCGAQAYANGKEDERARIVGLVALLIDTHIDHNYEGDCPYDDDDDARDPKCPACLLLRAIEGGE